MPPNRAQSVDADAFAAAMADPHIEARVRKLVSKSLELFEWTMDWGTDQERNALMRSSLPPLLRALAQKDDKQRNEEEHRAYQELRTAFCANVKVNVVGE